MTKTNNVYCKDCVYYMSLHADCSRCSSRNFFKDTGEGCGNLPCEKFNACVYHTEIVEEKGPINRVETTRLKLCEDVNADNKCKDFVEKRSMSMLKRFKIVLRKYWGLPDKYEKNNRLYFDK